MIENDVWTILGSGDRKALGPYLDDLTIRVQTVAKGTYDELIVTVDELSDSNLLLFEFGLYDEAIRITDLMAICVETATHHPDESERTKCASAKLLTNQARIGMRIGARWNSIRRMSEGIKEFQYIDGAEDCVFWMSEYLEWQKNIVLWKPPIGRTRPNLTRPALIFSNAFAIDTFPNKNSTEFIAPESPSAFLDKIGESDVSQMIATRLLNTEVIAGIAEVVHRIEIVNELLINFPNCLNLLTTKVALKSIYWRILAKNLHVRSLDFLQDCVEEYRLISETFPRDSYLKFNYYGELAELINFQFQIGNSVVAGEIAENGLIEIRSITKEVGDNDPHWTSFESLYCWYVSVALYNSSEFDRSAELMLKARNLAREVLLIDKSDVAALHVNYLSYFRLFVVFRRAVHRSVFRVIRFRGRS